MNKEWRKNYTGNWTLEIEGGYISYQPFNPEEGEPETALYVEKEDKFYILEGDWRNDYEKMQGESIEKYIEFFKKNEEFQSKYNKEEIETEEDLINSLKTTLVVMKKMIENEFTEKSEENKHE